MEKLKDTWDSLISLVAQSVTLRKFSEGSYDEDWDQGTANYTEYAIPARVKYEFTEREILDLGSDMRLDAILVVRKEDLDDLSLDVAVQDQFVINTKTYKITKLRPRIVAGQKAGYEIGLEEKLQ